MLKINTTLLNKAKAKKGQDSIGRFCLVILESNKTIEDYKEITDGCSIVFIVDLNLQARSDRQNKSKNQFDSYSKNQISKQIKGLQRHKL